LKTIACGIGCKEDLVQLGKRICCTRHTQTVRESTCKNNPTAKKIEIGYIHYVYQRAFLTHCEKAHTREEGLKLLEGLQTPLCDIETVVTMDTDIATIENSQGTKKTKNQSEAEQIISPSENVSESNPTKIVQNQSKLCLWNQIEDNILLKMARTDGNRIDWESRPKELSHRTPTQCSSRLSKIKPKSFNQKNAFESTRKRSEID